MLNGVTFTDVRILSSLSSRMENAINAPKDMGTINVNITMIKSAYKSMLKSDFSAIQGNMYLPINPKINGYIAINPIIESLLHFFISYLIKLLYIIIHHFP